MEPLATLYLDHGTMWIDVEAEVRPGFRPIIPVPFKHFGVDDPTDLTVGHIRELLEEFCDRYFSGNNRTPTRVHIEESVEPFRGSAYFSTYRAYTQ